MGTDVPLTDYGPGEGPIDSLRDPLPRPVERKFEEFTGTTRLFNAPGSSFDGGRNQGSKVGNVVSPDRGQWYVIEVTTVPTSSIPSV